MRCTWRLCAGAALTAAILFPPHAEAQRGGRAPGSTVIAAPMKGVVVTAHGKLKEITKKQIVLGFDDGALTFFRRTSKTKFVENDQPLKEYEFELESVVTVEAGEDYDLKLVALVVKMDKRAPPKPLKTRPAKP